MSWLNPDIIRARIEARVAELVHVGTARTLGNASAETIRTPSAWVVVSAETAGDNEFASCDVIEQVVTVRFGVIVAVRDIADRTGSRARDDLMPIRQAVHAAICTWAPPDAHTACRFLRGQLTSSIGRDGLMLWQDDFSVAFDRRTVLET